MIEAVEYVVRPAPIGSQWAVWMIELDASHRVPRFINSVHCSTHRTMAAADKKAAQMRVKDEAHISKIAGTRRYQIDPR